MMAGAAGSNTATAMTPRMVAIRIPLCLVACRKANATRARTTIATAKVTYSPLLLLVNVSIEGLNALAHWLEQPLVAADAGETNTTAASIAVLAMPKKLRILLNRDTSLVFRAEGSGRAGLDLMI